MYNNYVIITERTKQSMLTFSYSLSLMLSLIVWGGVEGCDIGQNSWFRVYRLCVEWISQDEKEYKQKLVGIV